MVAASLGADRKACYYFAICAQTFTGLAVRAETRVAVAVSVIPNKSFKHTLAKLRHPRAAALPSAVCVAARDARAARVAPAGVTQFGVCVSGGSGSFIKL